MEIKREYVTEVMRSISDKVTDAEREYSDNKRRLVAEFVRHNAGVYQSLVVKVTSRKKNWIGWSGTRAPMLSFTASGTFWQADRFILFPFSGSRIGYDVEEVNMFVAEGYNLPIGWGTKSGKAVCIGTNNVEYTIHF